MDEQPLESSGGDSPGQYGCSKSNVSTQVHWWPTPIFLRMTSLSVAIVIRRKNTRLSAVQKSVSMTTPVSKLPSHFCHGGWQKVSYHYFFFFCLLHLACAAFSSTYLPPVELSCSITAPITLLKLFLRLSLIFLSLIPIYFPKPHPWVQMGNIREEIKRLKSSLLQVKFLFFQRHEAGSRL